MPADVAHTLSNQHVADLLRQAGERRRAVF